MPLTAPLEGEVCVLGRGSSCWIPKLLGFRPGGYKSGGVQAVGSCKMMQIIMETGCTGPRNGWRAVAAARSPGGRQGLDGTVGGMGRILVSKRDIFTRFFRFQFLQVFTTNRREFQEVGPHTPVFRTICIKLQLAFSIILGGKAHIWQSSEFTLHCVLRDYSWQCPGNLM